MTEFIKQHYSILYPSESLDGRPGWTAKSYDPIRGIWFEIADWCPTQQAALQAAQDWFRELMREDQVVQTIRPVVEELKKSGFSLAEILNGFADLAHRDSYPDRVGYFLEEAARIAEEKQ